MVDFDSIMEAAQDAIDVVLDKSAEEDADVDFEASTEVDDQALDAVIGFTDNVLISDKDIEDIDSGKEPGDYDPVDVDARVPIAVEPYGSVTQHGRAYRPSKNDLYSLMKSWVNGGAIEADQQKYVVANLIRGGVFGGDSEG